MKTVRIRNNIYDFTIFLSFLAFFSCNRVNDTTAKDTESKGKDANHAPLVFNVMFETYGNKTLAFNKETTSVDTLTWKITSMIQWPILILSYKILKKNRS